MTKSILVIDDDHLVVKSLVRLLENEGYSVSGAESGNQALDLIRDNTFDLIISDIRMPDINGIQTSYNIRDFLKKNKKQAIPVIFITGYSDEGSYNEAKKLNKDYYSKIPAKHDLAFLPIDSKV